jgi:uncharacterized protein
LNISSVGALLDALVRAGATNIGRVEMTVSHPERFLDAARRAAFRNAEAKALLYSVAANVTLGSLTYLSERQTFNSGIVSVSVDKGSSSVPIEAGTQAFEIAVDVIFEVD